MHINHASLALTRFLRMRALMHLSPLPEAHAVPLVVRRAGASDDPNPLSKGSSFDPRGSAVEAGRPANQSDPGDECDCPACQSDCAGIVPCQRENDL